MKNENALKFKPHTEGAENGGNIYAVLQGGYCWTSNYNIISDIMTGWGLAHCLYKPML